MKRSGTVDRAARWAASCLVVGLVAMVLVSPNSTEGRPRPRRHLVEIRGMAFEPARLSARPGDSVIWVNHDIVPHTATAKGAGGPSWDTGVLPPDSVGRFVTQRPGLVAYICKLHPTMRAEIVIE